MATLSQDAMTGRRAGYVRRGFLLPKNVGIPKGRCLQGASAFLYAYMPGYVMLVWTGMAGLVRRHIRTDMTDLDRQD